MYGLYQSYDVSSSANHLTYSINPTWAINGTSSKFTTLKSFQLAAKIILKAYLKKITHFTLNFWFLGAMRDWDT